MFGERKITGKLIYKDVIYDSINIREKIDEIKKTCCKINFEGEATVALALPRSIYLVAAIFATLEENITFIPIDTKLPRERVLYMLENANVDCVFTLADNLFDFGNYKVVYLDTENYNESSEPHFVSKHINDVAYILYTSGTTGKPKAVAVTRDGFANFIQAIPQVIDFNEQNTIGCFTSATFDIFFLEMILPLYQGMTVVLASEEEKDNPKSIIKIIEKYSINMVQMTPSRLKLIKAYDTTFRVFRSVDTIMIGGEKFPYNILKDLQKSTNAKIYNMYGPTETTIWSTVSELTYKDKIDIGCPIYNTTIYLLSDDLEEVEQGEIGEICIGGCALAKGYLNNQKQTEKSFEYLPFAPYERIYHTGDFGMYDAEGDLLCLGRKDNQIKLRGHRIELDEIDTNFVNMPGVKAAATVYDDAKEELILFFVSDFDIEIQDIRKYLQNNIPQYMIPVICCRLTNLLYTASGKIDRRALLNSYLDKQKCCEIGRGSTQENELYEKVIKIMEKVTMSEFDNIDISTKLVDLGLNSISYISIIVSLEDEFDIEIEDEKLTLTSFATVETLVNSIIHKIKS